MPRFVARPVTVAAEQFTGTISFWPEQFRAAVVRHLPGGTTEIMTGDGVRPVRVGDWIVQIRGICTVWHEATFETFFEERVEEKEPADSAAFDKSKAAISRGLERKVRSAA